MKIGGISLGVVWSRWWFAISAVILILAADTKFRLSQSATAASGATSVFVLIELGLYLAVAVALMFRIGKQRIGRRPAALVIFVAYSLVMALSAAYAVVPLYAAVRALQTLILLALICLGVASNDRSHMHRFVHAFIAVTCLLVAAGVALPTAKGPLQLDRFNWFAVHPTVVGIYCSLCTVAALIYFAGRNRERQGPQWPPWLYLTAAAISVAGLYLSHTRSAGLAMIAGALVGTILVVRSTVKRRLIIVFGLVVGIAWLGVGQGITSFFERGETAESLSTLNSRTDLWEHAIETLEQRPLFGWGLGATRSIFLDETGLGGAHNAAINVAVDIGLIGLTAWILLIISIAAVFIRRKEYPLDRAIGIAALATLLIDGIFFEGLGGPSNIAAIWLGVLVCWSSILQRRPTAPPAIGDRNGVSV